MKQKRSSGIILHITSLPSKYGIGDFGPEAYEFAEFLKDTAQKYWQILPLNPVQEGSGYSPYSGLSAFAGNPLLISPELLQSDGWVETEDLNFESKASKDKVDFEEVAQFKNKLFDAAFKTFKKKGGQQNQEYLDFEKENSYWLDDFALFMSIKNKFDGKMWTEWPEAIRDREQQQIRNLKDELKDAIEKEKFLQFVFFKQWEKLKKHCINKNVHFFGDLPIYVGYDSADVWSNPQYFKLDGNKQPITVSGVPPDYFSETGQLWGTPVFDWDVLKEEQYDWWVKRIEQNLKMFDLLRLDHFRAFSAFWEVPNGEETAINGSWKKGPGNDLFNILKEKFPHMPFIAEDLGEIDDDVRKLMGDFKLPGMKVLLFAFGKDLPGSAYAPHHHIPHCLVYTGTHDNNTVRGWFENEASEEDKIRLSFYVNYSLNKNNVHEAMIRLAMMSVADLVIFPMQDILGLGQDAIMNKPSVAKGNWSWRLKKELITKNVSRDLLDMVVIFDRES
ncbi:MAG: 4-alpha-glucanotransferase [Bacteroidota bacterium]|nr:4-alpha-glucanotransferase [Bacteroidota bacterium]